MSTATETIELPFYLRDNFAPVEEELTATDLPIDGALPDVLRGCYLRNGPNPKAGVDPGHWFGGDGMVHGIRLEDGAAAWYRNRWVRGTVFDGTAKLVSEQGEVDHSAASGNTNVIGHAGKIFALVESSFPTELTAELDTVGTTDFGGKLTTSFTAHPKRCPKTGELHAFGYRFAPPFLTYHVLDAKGELVRSEEIAVPGPTMMHDFAITENYVIFMDLPIVFSMESAAQGMPYRWSDDYGARLGVMPRGGSNADIKWIEIEPCFIFHPMNAYDDGNNIVLDVARYPELWRESSGEFTPAMLHRYTLDLAAGTVKEEARDDRRIEFPRIDERLVGSKHRYGYTVASSSQANAIETPGTLVKYDLETGAAVEHAFRAGCIPGEAVFVPASADAGEDEGFVLHLLYDPARNASDLVVLDAAHFAAEPVATVHLPARVPFGFHGNWLPDLG